MRVFVNNGNTRVDFSSRFPFLLGLEAQPFKLSSEIFNIYHKLAWLAGTEQRKKVPSFPPH